MVINQINHQDSSVTNLRQLTSNPGPLLPTPSLWFKILWGDLIIVPLIMVMLKFKYEIELPPLGKKVGFNLLDDEDFKIPYITDTIPNSPAGHQLP